MNNRACRGKKPPRRKTLEDCEKPEFFVQLMYSTCLDVLYALYNYISPRRCSPLYVWLAWRGPVLRNASDSTFLSFPFNATLYSRMLLHELRVSSTKHSILRTARSIVLLNDGAEYEDNGNLQRLLKMRQQGSTSSTLNNHKASVTLD
jgi:hypothetical protein